MAVMDTLSPALSQKARLTKIKTQSKEFLNDRKNANNLIDIISCLEGDNEEVILAAVRALNRIFCTLITGKQMYLEKPPTEEADFQGLTVEEKYRMWLRERYADSRSRLLELLLHDNSQIQEQSLIALMKFVESEGHRPLKKIAKKHLVFPIAFLEQIVLVLINDQQRLPDVIARFQEFLEYDDVRYFTMKHVHKHIKATGGCTEDQMLNVFWLLEKLSMPLMPPPEGAALSHLISQMPDSDANIKMTSYKEHKKLFTTLWLEFLRKKLSGSLYKKVLVMLHEKVMPHMSNALLLADFLTTSYNIGGAISLLALNGIFILVNNFNLDYPDFYTKLYALLEPSVFHVKYRARFFFLTDLFLTSSHLPAYLIAAFAKKLSRLALTAPPSGLTVIIPLVFNLINRHPNCKALLHDPAGPQDLKTDPFDILEKDPAKCKALESSLWELKTLQNHYHHSVALEAKKIEHPLHPNEIELGELLETTTDTLFKKEIKKKMKTMPVTFEAPQGIFGSKDDRLAELWCLE